jgi:hypothetical protein
VEGAEKYLQPSLQFMAEVVSEMVENVAKRNLTVDL